MSLFNHKIESIIVSFRKFFRNGQYDWFDSYIRAFGSCMIEILIFENCWYVEGEQKHWHDWHGADWHPLFLRLTLLGMTWKFDCSMWPKVCHHHIQHANKLMHREVTEQTMGSVLRCPVDGDPEISGLFWDENNIDPADVWKIRLRLCPMLAFKIQ